MTKMELYEFTSSSSMIDVDEEEEKSNSCNNVNKVRNKKRHTFSGKREYFSSSDSSDVQKEGNGCKKKKIRKKIKRDIESSTNESSVPRKSSKGRTESKKPGACIKPSHNTDAFGFESEAIFSQVLKCENESVFSGEDSDQTVKSSCDNDEKEAEERDSVRVPSFNLTISDEEMTTDDGLPKLVSKRRKHNKSNTFVVKDTAKYESGIPLFSGKGRKFSIHDIEDKEFWSDQEMTSSDDDVPILQLNPSKLEEVTSCSSKEIKDKFAVEQDHISTNDKILSDSPSSSCKKLSQQSSTNCKQKLQMTPESSTQLKRASESELIREDMQVESDDETQPLEDDFDLPDLSPPHGEEESTRIKTEREHSPDIFKEEDPPDVMDETIYTQMDDCIFIEDSDEETLSQSLFQQEVKLELDDSSEDDVYIVDEEDESWRDILSLDDSDDDSFMLSGRINEMPDPDNSTDLVYKMATQGDADPYAGATQIDIKDSYSSATQIDAKNMYLSETQVDKSNLYSGATQMDNQDLCSSESDDDIYNATTQVDGSDVKIRKNKKSINGQDLFGQAAVVDSDATDESVEYERDPYASATQVDLPSANAMRVKKNRNSKEKKGIDPYMCATQCDKDSYVCETQVDQMDPYTGATQIDSLSGESPKNNSSSPADKVSSERDLFNGPTQKETSVVDPYDLATQVDSANQGHLSNYGAETEAFFDSDEDIILLSETESPESLSPNQTEKKACMETKTYAKSQSKNEKMVNGGVIKSEHSTGVVELATGPESDEDGRTTKSKILESMETKSKKDNQMDRNLFEDMYEMNTQVEDHKEKMQNEDTLSNESWSDMEFYEVDTQLDSLSDPKETVSLKEIYPFGAKSEPQKTGLSTEKSIKDTSDQSDGLSLSASSSSHMTSCSATSSMMPESSEQSSSDFEIVRSAKVDIPAKSKMGSLSHSTYHVPERTKSSNQKTAIPISPQRQKSTKEKREEFKISSFYSKKQADSEKPGRVVKTGSVKPEVFQKKGSTVPLKTTPDTGWLSKTSGKTNDRKRNRTASGGGAHAKKRKDEVTSTVNMDALIKAKAEMIARNWIRPLVPEPIKKPSFDTKSDFTDDVRMPELDEVIKKQLPLMDDRLLHSKKSNQDDVQVGSGSDDRISGSKARSSMDSSCSRENRKGDQKVTSGTEIYVNDSKQAKLKDRHHSKQHKSSSVDSDKSTQKNAKEKDKLFKDKDTCKNEERSKQRSSMEKDSLRRSTSKDEKSSTHISSREKDRSRSTSKDRDNSTKSGSKEKDSSRSTSKDRDNSTKSGSKEKNSSRSTSKDKDNSTKSISKEKDRSRSTSKDRDNSTKSGSKEKDSSRSTSKDKDNSTKSISKEKDRSRSTSKDRDNSTKSGSKEKDSSRSTSKDRDNSTKSGSKEKDSSKSTVKDKDSLAKSGSKEKNSSIKSCSKERNFSKDKDSLAKSSSNDEKHSRRSTSVDKDICKKSSSKDKEYSRSSTKVENDSNNENPRGSTLKDKSKYSKSKSEDNPGRSSSKDRSNSLDKGVSQSSSAYCSNHSEILSSSVERNRTESEAMESTAQSEILPFVFNSEQSTEKTETSQNNPESSSLGLKARDETEKYKMEICCEQGIEIQEEDMEDVKLGKLAIAAAIEKPLPSSQDQLEENDDSHVIIIDDEEEDEEKTSSCRKAPGSTKSTTDIKSILTKKFGTFFADRNDESTRKGQLIRFKLAPDRVSVRTQKYIDSLIQRKKDGVKSVQTSRPFTTTRPPLHQLPDVRRLSATTASHVPSNVPELPAKMAAHSSMDSSCVPAPSGPVRSTAGGGPRANMVSSQNGGHCSQFFSHLLKWNPTWFSEADKARDKREQRKTYEPPPVSPTVYPIPEKFDSYKDYVDIFIPHLLQEAWEQSYQSWRQLKTLSSYPQISAVYSGVERNSYNVPSQTFEKYTWYGITTKNTYEAMRKNDHLGEKFLVIIKDYGYYLKRKDRPMDEKYYHPNYFDQTGYIEKIQLHSHPEKLKQIFNTFKVLGTEPAARQKDAVVLCISILSRRRPLFKHLSDKLSFIQPVASLVTIVRQFQAVSFLPRSPVCKHILLPGQQDVFYEKVTISESVKHSLKHYNESQRMAICTSSQMILENPQSPKIGLLQGPPGTGKSSTVVGIVEKVLQSLGSNVRICLCAPSNNAVDLLIKRLDDHRKKMVTTELAAALSIVRIGNAECVHRDVKRFLLSDIFKEESIKWKTEKKKENIPRSVLENYHELRRRYEELKELRDKGQGHREEVRRINADLEKLEKRVTDMEKNHFIQTNDITISRAEEEQIKRGILQRATIICGTLSAFGQPFISNLLRNSTRRGKPIFDCIIVDEASQANELDCIIPLQYQANKLILVGDPEQLPPTIKSSKAAQNYFGQSLFERFYRHFQSCKTNVSPILMLDTQYRMHPDIAYWPSQYIYQGKLKTDRSVINHHKQNARLKPFILFDVHDSQENLSQTSGSVNNPTEVEFIVQLVLVILRSTRPQHVGIIAPYKSQKQLLSSSLAKKGVRNIEISTVDGFQGQEKEVIVFSCVRAQNQSKSIGFMADKKRMNVALTRAKSALYIVAHMDSLKEADADWRNMIEDAERRHLIHTVASRREFPSAVTQIVLKK